MIKFIWPVNNYTFFVYKFSEVPFYEEDQWFVDRYKRHFESFLNVDSVIHLPVLNLEENDSVLWDSIRNRFDSY